MPFIRGSFVNQDANYVTIKSDDMIVMIPQSDLAAKVPASTAASATINVKVKVGAKINIQIDINVLLNNPTFRAGHTLAANPNALGINVGQTLGGPAGRCDCFCLP
jgi:hypothetical protein